MAINIGTEENPTMVFVRKNGNIIDATVRANTKISFEQAALYAELMTEETDEDGNTTLVPSSGVNLDYIGPVILQQGTYDEEGNVLTEPVIDDRFHVNIRLNKPATEFVDDNGTLKWHKWATEWTQNGQPDTKVNSNEDARVLYDVALIDPDTISTPVRVWL